MGFFCLFLGKTKLQFVPRKFVCPPKAFRMLYGPEIRQTLLDNFVSNVSSRRQIVVVKKQPKIVQSVITNFFLKKK